MIFKNKNIKDLFYPIYYLFLNIIVYLAPTFCCNLTILCSFGFLREFLWIFVGRLASSRGRGGPLGCYCSRGRVIVLIGGRWLFFLRLIVFVGSSPFFVASERGFLVKLVDGG